MPWDEHGSSVLVVRELKAREYLGGAAIDAAHARVLGAQCSYLGSCGQDRATKSVAATRKIRECPTA